MNLTIIIVNWNVKDLLEKCLDSIYSKTLNLNFEVFVIDNASGDRSVEMVKSKYSEVKLISNKDNRGFAVANNQGIREAKGEFVLLLNPDTEIIDNALEKMVNFMKENKKVGVAGCKLLNFDKSLQYSVRRFPSLWSQMIVLAKAHHFFIKFISHYLALDLDYSKTQEVDQIMGAFFMIRRETIKQVGLLDENFYIWFEEVDFCKRVKNKGWKIYYTPQLKIIHHQGQSFKQVMNFKKQKEFNKSLRYYFKKHHSFISYLIISIFSPISLFLAYLIQIIKFVNRQLLIVVANVKNQNNY